MRFWCGEYLCKGQVMILAIYEELLWSQGVAAYHSFDLELDQTKKIS